MYKDPKRWAYLFQNYVLLTMLEAHNTPQTRPMRVMERSVYSARYCFIENLRKWYVAVASLALPHATASRRLSMISSMPSTSAGSSG